MAHPGSASISLRHSPLGAVSAGQIGAVASRGAVAGVVLQQQEVLTQGALVARKSAVVDELAPLGVTSRYGASWLSLQRT